MVGGIHTHLEDMLASHTSRMTGPNILLAQVVTVGGTLWFLVPCMRKLHDRPVEHIRDREPVTQVVK